MYMWYHRSTRLYRLQCGDCWVIAWNKEVSVNPCIKNTLLLKNYLQSISFSMFSTFNNALDVILYYVKEHEYLWVSLCFQFHRFWGSSILYPCSWHLHPSELVWSNTQKKLYFSTIFAYLQCCFKWPYIQHESMIFLIISPGKQKQVLRITIFC